MNAWQRDRHIDSEPVASEYDNYCSPLTSESNDDLVWSWLRSFDLILHDCAVTYTYLAAENDGKLAQDYALIACTLWQYSRQFRTDEIRNQYKSI